ncbi:hypothetical protein OSB04_006843 [Centaurea solstitialis]|uniref:CCHC-type domain-containing protein n=1 Tax=Centaurea solstitialis TaxID=347529 RepID=A0AA38U3A1_9ASTR|nr:hypothetical protein OSB04_006843 [Centaurea solstitialis]
MASYFSNITLPTSTISPSDVIEQLTGSNFATWRDSVKLTLGCPLIRGAIPDTENAKIYLEAVEEQFKGTSKAHASTLIFKMLTTKYDGSSGVREHIMMMNDMANKLKGMDMEISEGFLVHFIMTSLPAQFGPFKINYNTQREKWKMSELIAMSKGYRFYAPSHSTRIVETRYADFLENVNISGSGLSNDFDLQDSNEEVPIIQVPVPVNASLGDSNQNILSRENDSSNEEANETRQNESTQEIVTDTQETQPPVRRSQRSRKPKSFDDYITYLNEIELDIAMVDELNSMEENDVYELAELPKGYKPIGSKWVFKTKLDPKGNIERYKARLVAKGYTQKEGIDYQETFSPVSRKDSLRIVMALISHFDLELHQMDVKTTFLNGDLHENVYMTQPEGFISKGQEHLVCKLKKSIYGLKQASRQWYLKFDEVMKKNDFIKNQVDQCIYLKLSGRNFIKLVLYVDDILLASNNIDLLHESKRLLSRHFNMKDLGEASYLIGIEIHRDRTQGTLGLSKKAYIERMLVRYNMQHCSPSISPVVKGDVFGSFQCPNTEVERDQMKLIPYASVVGSYLDSDFAKCKDDKKSTSGYIFMLSGGPISWRSHKQRLTTTSTMMAEYAAVYNETCHGMLLKNLIKGLMIVNSIERPLKIYCDNSAAVSFSNNNSSSGAGLYLDTKYLFVRERVEENDICIEHISTTNMLADPMTKGLPPKVFQQHVVNMAISGASGQLSRIGYFELSFQLENPNRASVPYPNQVHTFPESGKLRFPESGNGFSEPGLALSWVQFGFPLTRIGTFTVHPSRVLPIPKPGFSARSESGISRSRIRLFVSRVLARTVCFESFFQNQVIHSKGIFFFEDMMSREIVSMGSESRPPVLVMGEYAQWKLRMIHFLDQLDRNLLKSIREGPVRRTVTIAEVPETDTCPLLPSYTVEKPYHLYNQEQRERHEIDKRAMSLLIMSLPNDMYSRVDSFDNARDIWIEIEQQMQGGDTASEFQKESAMNAYEGFHAREGELLHDSYQRLNSLVNDLRRLKVEKSRYEVNVKFLKNLNPEWRNLAINIQLSRNLGQMGLHDLFSMMVQHEEFITGNKPKKSIDPLALAAVHHGGSNLSVNPYPEEYYQDYHYDVSQDYYQHSDNSNDPTIITVTDEELHNMNESLALITHKMQRLAANRGFNRSSSHGGNRFGPGRGGHQSFDQGRGHFSQGGRYQSSDRGRGGRERFGNNFRHDNTFLDYQGSSGNGHNYQGNFQGSGYNQHGSSYNNQGSGYGQHFSGQGYEGKTGAGYDDGRFNHHSGSYDQGRNGGGDQNNHGGSFNGGSHPKQPPHGKGVQISEQQLGTSSTQVQNPQPMSSSQGKTNGHGPTCFKCGTPGHYAKDCKAVYKDAAYFEKKAALMRKKEKGVALLVDEENWVCEEESSDEEDHMVGGPCLMADFEAPDSSNTEVVDFDAEAGLQYNNDAFEVSSTPDISDCTTMLESKICALEKDLQTERILVTKFRTDSAVYKSSYEDLLISYNRETLESSIRETNLVNKLLSLNTSHDELKSCHGELELKFKLLSEERTKLFSKIKELEDNNLKRGQSEQTLHILTAHANNNPFYHAKPGLGHSDKNILDKAPSHLYTYENMSASKPKPAFVGGLTTVTFSEVINGEVITRTTSLSDNTSSSPPTSPTPIGPIFTPAKDPRNTNSDWENIKARTPKVAMPPIDYSNLNSSYDTREMELSEDVLVIPPKDVSATKSPDLVKLEKEIFELRLKAMDLDACQHQILNLRAIVSEKDTLVLTLEKNLLEANAERIRLSFE